MVEKALVAEPLKKNTFFAASPTHREHLHWLLHVVQGEVGIGLMLDKDRLCSLVGQLQIVAWFHILFSYF